MLSIKAEFLLLGLLFDVIQRQIGMRCLEDGLLYYSEVHTTFQNSLIHTLFMPLTMFGMFLWIPGLFKLSPENTHVLKVNASLFYIGLYIRINLLDTLLVMLLYYPSFVLSGLAYDTFYTGLCDTSLSELNVIFGFFISFVSLLVQEMLGHYMSGDPPSRFAAIPNAILYAPIYSVNTIKTVFNAF